MKITFENFKRTLKHIKEEIRFNLKIFIPAIIVLIVFGLFLGLAFKVKEGSFYYCSRKLESCLLNNSEDEKISFSNVLLMPKCSFEVLVCDLNLLFEEKTYENSDQIPEECLKKTSEGEFEIDKENAACSKYDENSVVLTEKEKKALDDLIKILEKDSPKEEKKEEDLNKVMEQAREERIKFEKEFNFNLNTNIEKNKISSKKQNLGKKNSKKKIKKTAKKRAKKVGE
ncbi:MAG: hypothetical protein MJ247_04220 [Alphaproteobacteria bacterium]|nr:hypothetical protein [Alphaproteobacteria bacterium]